MIYVALSTNQIYSFFNDYIETSFYTYTADLVSQYFSFLLVFLTVIIIVVTTLFVYLFKIKQKPIMFYVFILVNYVALLIMLYFAYSSFRTMAINVIDTREVTLIRDLYLVILYSQYLIIAFTITRALGFDLKKFNFAKDIIELDIDVADREEFEVNFNFDEDTFIIKVNRFIRNMKVYWQEHTLILSTILIIIFTAVFGFAFFNRGINNRVFNENRVVMLDNINTKVTSSYITRYGLREEVEAREGHTFVIVRVNMINNSAVLSNLNTEQFSLQIGEEVYQLDTQNAVAFSDFGEIYGNQRISMNTDRNFILLFEVKQDLEDEIILRYSRRARHLDANNNSNFHRIRLSPIQLEESEEIVTVDKPERMVFGNSILGDTSFQIDNFEIKDEFEVTYEVCVARHCYNINETIRASRDRNQPVTLLRVESVVRYAPMLNSDSFGRAIDLFRSYGYLEFEVEGELTKVPIVNVTPENYRGTNLWFEIPDQVKEIDSFNFFFNVRGMQYRYVITKDTE